MNLPKSVTVHDVTIRDGFQREEQFVQTDAKLFVVNRLIDAGVKRIEISNFANPRNLPQFKDCEELIKRLPNNPSVEYTYVTLNDKAVERAVRLKQEGYRIDRILPGVSTSEKHHIANTNKTHVEAFRFLESASKIAHDNGIKFGVVVTTIWGCPFTGKMDYRKAWEFVKRYIDLGAEDIEHADHDGEGTPDEVYEYFAGVMERYPDPEKHIFHIHDARGMGIAGYYAAMQAGINQFECTLGGIGGQPANIVDHVPVPGTGDYYVPGRRSGLVCEEDFLCMLDGMNIETGIDLDKIYKLGSVVEKILGRNLWSFASHMSRLPKA